jgi:hypothetical protein
MATDTLVLPDVQVDAQKPPARNRGHGQTTTSHFLSEGVQRRCGTIATTTPHIRAMQHLELSDEEADALAKELHAIIESDRCRLGSKLRAILHKLRPEPVRWAQPPQPWADLLLPAALPLFGSALLALAGFAAYRSRRTRHGRFPRTVCYRSAHERP